MDPAALLVLVLFFCCIATSKGDYPWPTPDWQWYYGRSTRAPTIVANYDNVSVLAPAQLQSEVVVALATSGVGDDQVCTTTACRVAARNIFGTVSSSADPCDNFFNYACGNFIASREIPGNEAEVSTFMDLIEKTKLVVQGMLDTEKDNMFQSEVKAKSIYIQCKNEEEIEALGAKPLLEMLDEEIGGWPLLNPNWNGSNFNLFAALTKIRAHGDQPFFSVGVDQDAGTPADNMVFITEPDKFGTKDVLLSAAGTLYTTSYMAYILNVTLMMMKETGDKRDVADVSDELTDLLDLGCFISLSGQAAVEMRQLNELKNKSSLGANQEATFTRSDLFRHMTDLIKAFLTPAGLADKISPDTQIVLRYSKFFDRMDEKLLELEQLGDQGKRRLANYIGWFVIASKIPYLSKQYRDAHDEHLQRILGQTDRKDITASERCSRIVTEALPLAVGAIFVRDKLSVDLKAKASMMIEDIKMGFKELLADATWMDNVTFTMAIRKLDLMLSFIAYPDELVNNITAIDEEYQDIRVGPSFFATLQEVSKLESLKNLKKLVKKNKRYDPIKDAIDITAVNAHNLIFKNLIVVQAAVLQRPFYETQNPQYLNYGGIGFVIGHEIAHGFDDQGRLIMNITEGLMRSWWTSSTTAAYNIRKQTFVDQYNAFNLSVGHVNGELTLGENIADNGGLKASYRAYFNHFQKRLASPDHELRLPGSPNVTVQQLFFLAAGQVWCGKRRPEIERLSLLMDIHSPYQFRVNGPMSNMPEFSEAFNCPSGSPMNPAVKSAVW